MPERKISYQLLEQKADSGFLVKAPSWQRLYIDAGLSLADILVKQDLVNGAERRQVKVSAENRESLLIAWLEEILTLFHTQQFLVKRIVFDQFDGKQIAATLWGEEYVPTRHGSAAEIETITSKNLQLGDSPGEASEICARIFFGKK